MRPLVRVAALVILAGLAIATRAEAGAYRYTSAAGGFAVGFPRKPQEHADLRDGLRLHGATTTVTSRQVTFVAVWMDHWPEAQRAPERALELELAGMAREGATIVGSQPIRFAGMPGLDARVTPPDGGTLHARFLIRGARVFGLMVQGPAGAVDEDAERFFASFALVGDGVPEPPPSPAVQRVPFPDAGFSVAMHGEHQAVRAAEAPDLRRTVAVSRGGLRMEIAAYLPTSPTGERARKQVLDRAVSTFSRGWGPRSEERDVVVSSRPAREFRSSARGSEAYVRVIVLDRSIVSLQVLGPPSTCTWEDAREFFDSLRAER